MNIPVGQTSPAPTRELLPRVVWRLVQIAFVILIVMAAFQVASEKVIGLARHGQAKAQMKGLELAVNGYRTEYGHWPGNGGTKNETPVVLDASNQILPMLIVREGAQKGPAHPGNLRMIRFFDSVPARDNMKGGLTTEGALLDPWGNPFVVVVDYNDDDKVAIPEDVRGIDDPSSLATGVIAYSKGPPPHDPVRDYVRSWR